LARIVTDLARNAAGFARNAADSASAQRTTGEAPRTFRRAGRVRNAKGVTRSHPASRRHRQAGWLCSEPHARAWRETRDTPSPPLAPELALGDPDGGVNLRRLVVERLLLPGGCPGLRAWQR
jgi:hypothetical protein